MRIRTILYGLALAGLVLLQGCSRWDSKDCWYDSGREVRTDLTDVFYICSTNVLKAVNEDGTASMRSLLAAEDRAALTLEMAYMDGLYGPQFNYFSPFYHQFTMEALELGADEFSKVLEDVSKEICSAFDYYMEHLNGGRRFIISGFSQGAMLVKELLRHMSEEQYSRLVAAYAIGFEVTEEDLLCPHIRPATSASDTGVTISFNSVADTSGRWRAICSNPAICINPLNWHTDATASTLEYGQESLTVALDTLTNMVLVTGFRNGLPKSPFEEPWPKGCLHGQEIIIFRDALGSNALLRAYGETSPAE